MASNRVSVVVAVMVMLLAALVVVAAAAQATEKLVNSRCMTDYYFDCIQIKIFNEGECKRECVVACARYLMKKRAEEDDSQFFPLWI
ncbi:hypothetical protein OROHE_008672 [Orobanche hederae]